MRTALISILSSILVGFVSVSCDDNALEWSPSMLNNMQHPFDAGRFIFMCFYNEHVDSLGNDVLVSSISTFNEEAQLLENVAYISADTLYMRSASLNSRIDSGYNTFIAAQTIIPVFKNVDADNDSLINEYLGEPLPSVKGDKFSLDSFFCQAKTQSFPMADISAYPKSPIIQMPAVLCTRTLSKSSLLMDLGIESTPKYSEVMMTAAHRAVAVRYTFSNNAHLTLLSSPLLLSNYSMSYENAQMAPRVMNLMRYAFASDSHPADYLPHISFFIEEDMKRKYSQYYTADKDPTKKEGRPFSFYDDDDPDSDLSTLWRIICCMLMVFAPLLLPSRRRAIPVYDGYRNKSAEYAKHVGVMYSDEGNLKLILDNLVSYFYYGVKNKYGVDLTDSSRLSDNASLLASHWNRGVDEVTSFLHRLNDVRTASENQKVSKEQLAQLCEQMNLYTNL